MKLGVYITATEPISTMYFINPFHQFVCLYVYVSIVVRHRYRGNEYKQRIQATIEELLDAVRALSKESLWVSLCTPLTLLGNNSVTMFPRRQRIDGGVIFYAVRALSKACLWVTMCIPLSLPGNNSVKTFPCERRTVGDVVFYAVRIVSKESMRLILPRTSYKCQTHPFENEQFFSHELSRRTCLTGGRNVSGGTNVDPNGL
jgi:hypothetical protein